MNSMLDQLERDGFLVRDNLLHDNVIQHHKSTVQYSWDVGDGWMTRVKAGDTAKVFARQDQKKLTQIKKLVRNGTSYQGFQYLYHSLHQKSDTTGFIAPILHDVKTAWGDIIAAVAPDTQSTNFSLTAFTPGCFLDAHNDYRDGSNAYRVTLLLYFGGQTDTSQSGGGLVFDYRGKQQTIEPRYNRSILFVPTPETNHWIAALPERSSPRLALSGWLL